MFNIQEKGFTFIETVITVFVVLVGVTGLLVMLQTIFNSISVSSARLEAAYLTKEGIEIVRNIRDGNWLEYSDNAMWKDGIPASDGWEVDYNTDGQINQISDNPYGGGRFLNIDVAGFYSYSSGTATKFKRQITIVNDDPGVSFGVQAIVLWSDKGENYQFVAEEVLYNWR